MTGDGKLHQCCSRFSRVEPRRCEAHLTRKRRVNMTDRMRFLSPRDCLQVRKLTGKKLKGERTVIWGNAQYWAGCKKKFIRRIERENYIEKKKRWQNVCFKISRHLNVGSLFSLRSKLLVPCIIEVDIWKHWQYKQIVVTLYSNECFSVQCYQPCTSCQRQKWKHYYPLIGCLLQ